MTSDQDSPGDVTRGPADGQLIPPSPHYLPSLSPSPGVCFTRCVTPADLSLATSRVSSALPPAGRKPVLRRRLTQRGRKRGGWRGSAEKSEVRIQIFISAVVPVCPSLRLFFLSPFFLPIYHFPLFSFVSSLNFFLPPFLPPASGPCDTVPSLSPQLSYDRLWR